MRIIDWSSDVCSSDLGDRLLGNAGSFHHAFRQVGLDHFPGIWEEEGVAAEAAFVAVDAKIAAQAVVSSAAAQQVVAGEAEHQIVPAAAFQGLRRRSEEHTSELQSLMRISYAVVCLKKKTKEKTTDKSAY